MIKLRKPSPAMVVALIALLVALTDTAAAGLVITSANIKNGTIQLVDISGKAKRALKGVGYVNPSVMLLGRIRG